MRYPAVVGVVGVETRERVNGGYACGSVPLNQLLIAVLSRIDHAYVSQVDDHPVMDSDSCAGVNDAYPMAADSEAIWVEGEAYPA